MPRSEILTFTVWVVKIRIKPKTMLINNYSNQEKFIIN